MRLKNWKIKKKEEMMNSEYAINCTGDCCVGDEIVFERAVFEGIYPKARFSHMETVKGKIINDSYGSGKQQHTFTLLVQNGPNESKIMIKGRNLYRNGVMRKPWEDELLRGLSLDEKHERGELARKDREERKEAAILYGRRRR